MVPKEGKGAKPVTKIVNYLVKKCGFRYFKSFCSLCKRLVFIFLASSIWFETSLNCTFPWAPIKWTPILNIKFNTQIIMEKLTFEPMKIERQHKKNPHLMPCNINKLMVWQGTLIPSIQWRQVKTCHVTIRRVKPKAFWICRQSSALHGR